MTALTVLNLLHYTLVLTFGLLLSAEIAGENILKQHKTLMLCLLPSLLLLQGILWFSFDTEAVEKLYPFITHLPLILILVFACKKSIGVSVVSVCTAYLCCQIPHWGQIAVESLTHKALIGEVCYIVLIVITYLLLHRYFVKAVHPVITHSYNTLFLFGSLPIAYYIFDYATTVYSDVLYTGFGALHEFLPTVLVVFYVIFLTAYHWQMQEHMKASMRNSMLEMQQKQVQTELNMLRQAEKQAAIYQHDMRHHLMVINDFIQTGKYEQALAYIHRAENDITTITPRHFCENEIVNLLCSSFFDKAQQQNIRLNIKAKLPKTLPVSDTDLCALLSNGLENALHATAKLDAPFRYVDFYCETKQHKLLIEIKNPYIDTVTIENGIPVSTQAGHGYGCQSIRSITERYNGICTFQTEQQLFILRVVLPIG